MTPDDIQTFVLDPFTFILEPFLKTSQPDFFDNESTKKQLTLS